MIYWIFFNTTYWISTAGRDTTDTIEGPNFFTKFLIKSSFVRNSRYLTMSLTDPKTTAGLMWLNLGNIRSITLSYHIFYISAYLSDLGVYFDKKSRMKTWAHSILSLIATSILLNSCSSTFICAFPERTAISSRDAIALASTSPFGSLTTSASSRATRFLVYESLGAIS